MLLMMMIIIMLLVMMIDDDDNTIPNSVQILQLIVCRMTLCIARAMSLCTVCSCACPSVTLEMRKLFYNLLDHYLTLYLGNGTRQHHLKTSTR